MSIHKSASTPTPSPPFKDAGTQTSNAQEPSRSFQSLQLQSRISPSNPQTQHPNTNIHPRRSLHCTLCTLSLLPNDRIYRFPPSSPTALTPLLLRFLHSSFDSRCSNQQNFPPAKLANSYTRPSSLRICHVCFLRIYNLSICWACGEVVYRAEERVGYGWCWWH